MLIRKSELRRLIRESLHDGKEDEMIGEFEVKMR
jgi:hypothetical protein